MNRRLRDLSLQLSPDSDVPLALQITRAVAQAIRNGRLRDGDALPGSRQMAEELGVHRNTVLAALKALESEGWVEARQGSGTFVRALPAELTPVPWGRLHAGDAKRPVDAGFDLPEGLDPITAPAQALLNLAEGLPDVRLAPAEALAKAYQRAIRLHGDELLQYGEPQGNRLLRESLADMLGKHRGMAVTADQIIVTRGSRMGLDLVGMALLRGGGAVAVEDPGHRGDWDTLARSAPGRLVPIPVDREGLDTEALERALATEPIALVHLSPTFQHPTGVTLSPGRRRHLRALAARHRLAILEQDAEWAYGYEERAEAPLAAEDPSGHVIHLGSLSRLLAPGVRLGYVVAPKALVERLARVRLRMDWQGDRVLEWAVGDLWRDGEVAAHLRKVRKLYRGRRDAFCGPLADLCGGRLRFEVPRGGLGVWAGLDTPQQAQAWWAACRAIGVAFHPPSHYAFEGSMGCGTRLGFAALDEAQALEAVRRLAAALRKG